MKKRKRNVIQSMLFCAAAAGLMLAGCGVDKVSPPTSSSEDVAGVAAVGRPIRGTVTLKDSSSPSKIKTTVTNTDGSYRFEVKGLQPPFILKVKWEDDNATTLRLHSLAKQHGRANINPLTDVILAGAAGADDPTTVFDSNDPAAITAAAEKLMAALEALRTVLAPLFQLYGADGDPIRDHFEADHTGLDALFDDVRIYAASGMIVVRNKRTNSLIFSAPINDIASGTFYANNLPVQPGTLNGPALYAGKCAGCHGALAASAKTGATAAEIQAAIAADAGGMGSLANLTALEIQAIAAALDVTSPPAPAACAYTYDVWGPCQANGTQTRTMLTSSPDGCAGTPVLSQACTYVPPSPAACTYTYNAWGACQSNNTQTRTVATSSPAGCVGIPVLSQSCTYVPPAPVCGSCHSIPPTTGKHTFHSSRATCASCHGTGYSATAVNAATHADGVKNIVSSLNFNAATGTCGSPGCHGSRAW